MSQKNADVLLDEIDITPTILQHVLILHDSEEYGN